MTGSAIEIGTTGSEAGRHRPAARSPRLLERIVGRLVRPAEPIEHARYLALLDRCLLDRSVSRTESDRLVEAAAGLGIDRPATAALNRRYFDALVRAAREEAGVVATGARADLASVAALLRIAPAVFEAAVAPPPRLEAAVSG